jgi:hypothetical protein
MPKSYSITNYTRRKAKQMDLIVKRSTNKSKKIDVFSKRGKKLASVGALGMNDFPTYIQKRGMKFAKTRRRLYRIRHERDRHVRGTSGWYADKLLW